jgi:Zn-dependent peptidase ImmA (M78 family)
MVSFPEYMAVARINGGIITWALKRLGANLESLATPKVSPATIEAWVNGEQFPSEGQAEDLADRLGIAYAMLYMPEVPPDEPINTPDLRTIDGSRLSSPSLNLLKVLDTTRARQEWYREELKSISAPTLDFIGKFSHHDSPKVIARDMRNRLLGHSFKPAEFENFDDFLSNLTTNAEQSGILIMRSALVGHATTRVLDVTEFRGFVLIDTLAPIIFINDNDAKAAQIFTFAHELAHIWIGASGISDRRPDTKGDSTNPTEIMCDRIAAEFLVPETEFLEFWSKGGDLDNRMWSTSRHFRVSTLVILRRAKDFNLISPTAFFAKVDEQYERYKVREIEKREAEKKREKKGGNFWASFDLRNSAKFNSAVVNSVREQKTTYAEAGSLFGVTPLTAARYMNRQELNK